MAKPTIANLRREHLEEILGLTPVEGGKLSYNDLVYRYTQFQDTVSTSSSIEGFSFEEINEALGNSPNPRQHKGVGNGIVNDTDSLRNTLAAGAGGTVVIPPGTWLTDPLHIPDRTTVIVQGIVKLRPQPASGLPSSHGVLYAYGTETTPLTGVRIIGQGGRVDGNRLAITGSKTMDMEGVNFKWVNGGEISGLEVFNAIESGIDLDNSQGNILRDNNVRDCPGYGYHMSNGAVDNLVEGNTAINCGHANSRGGFDQYAGSAPFANRNRYIGNRAVGNYRNYNIAGEQAVFDGNNVSIGGTMPDVITADISILSPYAPVRQPSKLTKVSDIIGGSTVDVQARETIALLTETLASLGLIDAPVLIVNDSFNRPNGNLGVSDTGQNWTGYPSIFQIGSNKVVLTPVTATGWTTVAVPQAANARIEVDLTMSPVRGRSGIMIAQPITGASQLILEAVTTGEILLRRRTGTAVTIASGTDAAITPGATIKLRADIVGPLVTVYVNGVEKFTYTLTGQDVIDFVSSSYRGLYTNIVTTPGSQEDGDTTFDNFKVYKI